MKIKKDSDSKTKKLKSKHTNGEIVKFNAAGIATVKKEIGKQMVENYQDIKEHKIEKNENNNEDTEDNE